MHLHDALCSRLLSVHVGVAEFSHEGIGTHHLLDAHTNRELSISIAKLVDVDGDHVGVVVKLDESLSQVTVMLESSGNFIP